MFVKKINAMTSTQFKRNLGRIVFDTRSGRRYFLKEMIGNHCMVNRMIGYLDKDRKYQEWKSEINYCSDIIHFSTKNPNTNGDFLID